MKEVTEWNGKPRMMWVWDDDEDSKRKDYVVYILSDEDIKLCDANFPVKCGVGMGYQHCAEITEESDRMTNYELAKWLYEGASCGEFRECKYSCNIYSFYSYGEEREDKPCPDGILIRSNGGEWREPLVEVEE